MAIAKPSKMAAKDFYSKVDQIAAWFEKLNPYNFPGSVLKVEDVNYRLKMPKIREPLFVWAVSAKRYALFNIDRGKPIIRKASAHGLGQLQAPYDEADPSKTIPLSSNKLEKVGVAHWHQDFWWLIAKAAIDGKPDQIKLDHHPALKKPAANRYAATTPKSLGWFNNYNESLPYSKKVKPFGFVSAFSAKLLIENTTTRSKSHKAKSKLKPVAPFDKNPAVSAKMAFDRISGNPIEICNLKTYQQALAQYHLHPEDKFLNGESRDCGVTQRRHIQVTGTEYIGKESNKWEDQYYFGFDEDEEIRYGAKPANNKSLQINLEKIANAKGLRVIAKESGISRAKLSKLLKDGFSNQSPQFSQRIAGVLQGIQSRHIRENAQLSKLLRLARAEIRKIGIWEFARRLRLDSSNLAKIAAGERSPSVSVLQQLHAYFEKPAK